MRIGLIDVDGHNWPNLPLMKLSMYHKIRCCIVRWYDALVGSRDKYDIVYASKVFDFTPDYDRPVYADKVVYGGTGYDLTSELPPEAEHIYPDYSLYNISDTAYGFLTRGCPRNCGFCIVSKKEGCKSMHVGDVSDFWRGQKFIKLLDPNLLACKDRDGLLRQLAGSRAWVDFTQGLDARLLDIDIIAQLNEIKTKTIRFAWDNPNDSVTPSNLALFAEHSKIKNPRRRGVYILTNYNSTHEQDLYRVYKVRGMGFDPYVMVYNKAEAPEHTRFLQRWVNNKRIFRSCARFEDYRKKG